MNQWEHFSLFPKSNIYISCLSLSFHSNVLFFQTRQLLENRKKMRVKSLAAPSMGFSRQEYLSGLPFPSPGDLPEPGIEPESLALEANALSSEPPGKS